MEVMRYLLVSTCTASPTLRCKQSVLHSPHSHPVVAVAASAKGPCHVPANHLVSDIPIAGASLVPVKGGLPIARSAHRFAPHSALPSRSRSAQSSSPARTSGFSYGLTRHCLPVFLALESRINADANSHTFALNATLSMAGIFYSNSMAHEP